MQKRCEFRKNCAYESPLRGKFVDKIPNLTVLGLYCHIFAPITVKFGTWSGSVPNFMFIGAKYRHAALQAGLPVSNVNNGLIVGQCTRAMFHLISCLMQHVVNVIQMSIYIAHRRKKTPLLRSNYGTEQCSVTLIKNKTTE